MCDMVQNLTNVHIYILDSPCEALEIVSRDTWSDRKPTSKSSIPEPVSDVFIHHTEIPADPCFSEKSCTKKLKAIQDYHMDKRGKLFHMRGCRRGWVRESGPPLKNHKNIGSLSNTGPDSLKLTKLPRPDSMLGHHRHASETLFKLRFACKPITAR